MGPALSPSSATKPQAERVLLYDTTLRDGAQMVGLSLSGDDKLAISRHLIHLGVAYIEGGWPGSNVKDAEFFRRFARDLSASAASAGTRLAAFGATRRRNATCESDPQVQALIACEAPCVTLVAKSWAEQVERVIGATREENLRMISDTVRFFKAHGREVALDAEHFFDGAASDRQYALDCLLAAAGAGADFLVLCDTNGAAMPWDVEAMVRDVAELVGTGRGGAEIGMHAHNDGGLAVANSLSAVRGGARMVQGCMNGYGERTGNADLIAIAGDLETKMGRRCLPDGGLQRLTAVSRAVASQCRLPHYPAQPYAGAGAFAHKGGLHVAAIRKMPTAYNHIDPTLVGNEARTVVSELSGRGNVQEAALAAGLPPLPDDVVATVLAQVRPGELRPPSPPSPPSPPVCPGREQFSSLCAHLLPPSLPRATTDQGARERGGRLRGGAGVRRDAHRALQRGVRGPLPRARVQRRVQQPELRGGGGRPGRGVGRGGRCAGRSARRRRRRQPPPAADDPGCHRRVQERERVSQHRLGEG